MSDFFADLEGHLHDAARRRARRRWAPASAPRIVLAVAAAAAVVVAAFGALAAVDGGRDPEVAAPSPAPPAQADAACGAQPPRAVLDRFAVLRREPTAADRAPRAVTRRLEQDFPGVGMPAKLWPEAGRLAREVDGKRFWLFPVLLGRTCEPPLFDTDVPVDRPREPGLCWVFVDAGTNMAICHALADLKEPETMVMSEGERPYVSAVVPDGTTPVATDGDRIVNGTTEGNVFYAEGASDLADKTAEAEPEPGCASPAVTRDEPAPELLEVVPGFRGDAFRLPASEWREALAEQPVRAHVRNARQFLVREDVQIFGVPYSPPLPRCTVEGAPAEAGACLIAAPPPPRSEYFTHCFTGTRIAEGRALVHDSAIGLAYALVPAGTRSATYGGRAMRIDGDFAYLVAPEEGDRMEIAR